ncbi:MAG: type IV secretion system DNA-binding domain-containing protein [Parcubacteria group bacterium]|nr:type IV secretion system DNA-binding domain-containing protein [Parcubacteria group bacterium]
MDEKITILGKTNFRNAEVRFGIKRDDRRRHIYVIGKTGMGKTELLKNIAVSDIRAGYGIGIIDPHGEFADELLNYIPKERLDDVIYFNPSDSDFPIAFNPLEQVGNEQRFLVASGIMGVFKKIWPDVWSARMEYILNNALLALLEYPNSTILGVMRLLSDKDYRKKVVDNLQDPVIKNFWVNEFSRYSQKFETEATAAIQNKIGQLIANPLMRNIIGQPHSAINLRRVMDEQKIFIANLSKGRIGEDNSSLLGGMLITKLQLAAMSRADVSEAERKDFYLTVDEFQNFATDSFANIFSEARKYRLNLIVGHQYIRQLMHEQNTKVRDAVFGNVGTEICFRVGAEDAEFLEKEFTPNFLAADLINLAKYNIYIKLLIDGAASRPFSAVTLPPPPVTEEVFRDVIIENTRVKYATKRELVEKRIAQEWQPEDKMMDEKIMRREERPLSQALGAKEPFRRPFSPRKDDYLSREKKHVNIGELREALSRSLDKQQDQNGRQNDQKRI